MYYCQYPLLMLSLTVVYSGFIVTMHTGQFYKRTKKTSLPNRIIKPSKESDDDMVGSSDSERDISIESNSTHVGSEESFISEEGLNKSSSQKKVKKTNRCASIY